MRRTLMGFLLLVLAVTIRSEIGIAQTWPTRTVRLVVPYPPGGPADLVGRTFAAKLSEIWGQAVVIENISNASGNIAPMLIARATPDGSAFMLHSLSMVINAMLYKAPGYDPFANFTPISQVADYKLIVVVHPSVPVTSLKELVDMAKAKPGHITYASAGGAGAATHLAVEMFAHRAGIDLRHVPYDGAAPSTNGLLAGHVMMMFNNPLGSLQYIKTGQLRALAVTGLERNPLAPDLPTVAELGYPGFEAGAWYGIWGPAGLPAEIVKTASEGIMRVARMPDVVERLRTIGLNPIGGTPDALGQVMRVDHERWGNVIREEKITLD